MADIVGKDSWLWDVFMGAASVAGRCLMRMHIRRERKVSSFYFIARGHCLMTYSACVRALPEPDTVPTRPRHKHRGL